MTWLSLAYVGGTEGGETIIISGAVEAIVEEVKIEVSVENAVEATVEISEPATARVENVVDVAVTDENIKVGVCG